MKNVETRIEGTSLIITIDLRKTYGPSKSGKTIIIASTEGFVKLGGEMSLGLNVVKAK